MKHPIVCFFESPIKSTGLTRRAIVDLDENGIVGDRRFMVVDQEGNFCSQRDFPTMALITSEVRQNEINIHAPGMTDLSVITEGNDFHTRYVRLRRSEGYAIDLGESAAEWFSDFLHKKVRLVKLSSGRRHEDFFQLVESKYNPTGKIRAGFTDGFPLTILSTGSFADLYAKLPRNARRNVVLENFRMNIIVEAPAFEEDKWETIRIGNCLIGVVKPCARCDITTVDTTNGIKCGQEPLRTLAKYRTKIIDDERKVFFGQNLIHDSYKTLWIENGIEVIKYKDTARV